MNSNTAIKVENLTKIYHLYDKPQDRLKEALNPFKKSYHHDFYALNDVSFEIKKGETVGIIGKNGAGKSTLLKMITGVLTPTSGNVQVKGKIASLLELGAGFNPEMTGLENIYLNGTLMGFTHEEMANKVGAILEFADIGEFIHQQTKTYSSGMFARLAFSVAINVKPDILIVDEALSVGDLAFQMRCLRQMQLMQESGITILFVTHDTGVLQKFCTRGLLIDNGTLLKNSSVVSTINSYRELLFGIETKPIINTVLKKDKKNQELIYKENFTDCEVVGDQQAIIAGICIVDKNGYSISNIQDKMEIIISIKVQAISKIFNPIVGFTFKDRLNNIVFQTNTFVLEHNLGEFKDNQIYIIDFTISAPPLNNGKYSITPAIASGTQISHTIHQIIHDALFIDFSSRNFHNLEGYFYLDNIKAVHKKDNI